MSFLFFFFKQKTAYEMRISDWSSDVCSSDLDSELHGRILHRATPRRGRRPCHEVPACVIVPAVRTVCGADPVGACRAAGPSLQRLVEARPRVLSGGTPGRRMAPSEDRKSTRLTSSH